MLLNELLTLTERKKSSSFVLPKHRGMIMLMHRTKDGMWGLPGGQVDKGEGTKKTATRETEEEAGMKLKGVKKAAEYKIKRRRKGKRKSISVYKDEVSEKLPQLKVNKKEHKKVGFFKKAELKRLAKGKVSKIGVYDEDGNLKGRKSIKLHTPIVKLFD